jgi:hypothetical protein
MSSNSTASKKKKRILTTEWKNGIAGHTLILGPAFSGTATLIPKATMPCHITITM